MSEITTEIAGTDKVRTAKRKINQKRIDIQDVKSETGKLGGETVANVPPDLAFMYAGKLTIRILREEVAVTNIITKYKAAYGEIPKPILDELEQQKDDYCLMFDKYKKSITKMMESHPLWLKMKGIRGFTPYQLAIIMAMFKNGRIEDFDTPTKACVYAGLASINGMPVIKKNLAKIREHYATQGKEFGGFNTILSGRFTVIVECLLRAQGYFLNMYQQLRKRLTERAINGGETFIATQEDCDKEGSKMEKGRHYMVGRKNQSVEAWADWNAKRRVARTLLHLIYTEWRLLKGLTARNPYPIDYLGHQQYISLKEVKDYDAGVVVVRKKKSKDECEVTE